MLNADVVVVVCVVVTRVDVIVVVVVWTNSGIGEMNDRRDSARERADCDAGVVCVVEEVVVVDVDVSVLGMQVEMKSNRYSESSSEMSGVDVVVVVVDDDGGWWVTVDGVWGRVG